jgi:hypothetical protein
MARRRTSSEKVELPTPKVGQIWLCRGQDTRAIITEVTQRRGDPIALLAYVYDAEFAWNYDGRPYNRDHYGSTISYTYRDTYRNTSGCYRRAGRQVRENIDLIGCLAETTPAWFANHVSPTASGDRMAGLMARRRTIFIPTSVENMAAAAEG